MLRFRLGPFPVEIHPSHLIISGFIAWSFVSNPATSGWPATVLSDAQHPNRTMTLVLVTLAWMVLVSLSVFAHELGHAIAARAFGLRPSIHFVGLGGATMAKGKTELEWWRQVLITLAGPGAGLAFGVVFGAVALVGGAALPEEVRYFARGIFFANMGWTVLNLLPLSALDGGDLTQLVLTRALGRPGFLVAQFIAIALSFGVLMLAVIAQAPMLGILVLLFSARTIYNISAYFRGELPAGFVAHPLTPVVERAEALYRERKLDEAHVLARGLVEAEATPPQLRSRAHLLLGWISLKQGNGRRALDHFAQVQGFTVPAQAAAAAFSLIGDDHRAVPLWAQAYSETPRPEVLDEYVGALLRAGREAEARALPNADLVRGWLAAERVAYVRKAFEAAATAAEAAFKEAPAATHAYTAACDWALAGKREEALRWLDVATQHGYRDAAEAEVDADLRALRDLPDFQRWLQSLKASPAS